MRALDLYLITFSCLIQTHLQYSSAALIGLSGIVLYGFESGANVHFLNSPAPVFPTRCMKRGLMSVPLFPVPCFLFIFITLLAEHALDAGEYGVYPQHTGHHCKMHATEETGHRLEFERNALSRVWSALDGRHE
jgi:hypothetical protein